MRAEDAPIQDTVLIQLVIITIVEAMLVAMSSRI